MFYSKKEEYAFNVPREYSAYLRFKEELQESRIRFIEEQSTSYQTIIIYVNGCFTVNDDGSFDLSKKG